LKGSEVLYLRFLVFFAAYAVLFWFLGSFLGVTIGGIVQSTCDEQTFKAAKDVINWILRVWVLLFTPVLAFQTARRRATTEVNFWGSFKAALLDFRMMFGIPPTIEPDPKDGGSESLQRDEEPDDSVDRMEYD
jgi:hypothetical protein